MFTLCQFYHIRWYIFTIGIAKKKGKKILMWKPCNKKKNHSFTYRCSAMLGYHDILWNGFISWGYHDILWNGFISWGYHDILWNGFISWGETFVGKSTHEYIMRMTHKPTSIGPPVNFDIIMNIEGPCDYDNCFYVY